MISADVAPSAGTSAELPGAARAVISAGIARSNVCGEAAARARERVSRAWSALCCTREDGAAAGDACTCGHWAKFGGHWAKVGGHWAKSDGHWAKVGGHWAKFGGN